MVVNPVEAAYLLVSTIVALSGIGLLGTAVRAYVSTEEHAMVYLSIGFTFFIAGTVSTTLSAFLIDFESSHSLLLVENAFLAIAFAAIGYSLWIFE